MSPAVTHPPRDPRGAGRRGFTLIELMIVMVIIGLLVGLLFVGLRGATVPARVAQVRTEISGLETALMQFKEKYGSYPPSRITLYESGADWAGTGTEQVRSRSILRGFWTQINFAIDRDFNSDGDTTDTIELRGAECLAFFLGGMRRAGTGQPIAARVGFSKNPANPFENTTTNREGPFFEFNPSRIQESRLAAGMPVYFDPLPNQQRPYLYISAYDGQGFDRNATSSPSANRDATTFGLTGVDGERLTAFEYWQTASESGPKWKDKSFQIISPGFDGQFGEGREWNENTADTMLGGTRSVERDNITNFHGGTLAPN